MSDNEENNSQEEIQEENPEESPASQEEPDDNDQAVESQDRVAELNGSPRERASSLAKRRMSSPNIKEGFQTTEGEEGEDGGEEEDEDTIVLKVGMIGDSAIGKTSLMVKYVENTFDEDYVSTLGVNFLEKVVEVKDTKVTFSIWDLGGHREFLNMLPLVCNEAAAFLFMFDLTRLNTLNSLKEWYRQARGFNKTAIPILIGTKYDQYANFDYDTQEEITEAARKFAKAMNAPLLFCSSSHSINVQKIFKIVMAKCFNLKLKIPKISKIGDPIIEY
eukprot:TRINITY_DN14200_c0_g1_i1.p1 TRINITY_DN14200_c0_g1~~TRINITY_DN14200_c0_g1_i1.p1  ORF type:complete len:276 (-),score=60.85 TRINITY_DN14200_c0_g1_i1:126-953(-)